MKRLLAFGVPFVVVFGLTGGAVWWSQAGPAPRGEPVEVAVDALSLEEPFVRVAGTAHYAALVKQKVPPRWPWGEIETWYLFPLFPEDGALDRGIRVFVRTTREPERMVHYEGMVIEGRLTPATERTVPYSTAISLDQHTDYFLTDEVLILEPWRIEAEDGVWTP